MQLSYTHEAVYSTVIIVLALSNNCKALKLSCGSDSILEVKEGTANNSVTCNGLVQTNTVEWYIDSATYIGSCSAPTNGQDTCTDKILAPIFVPSRKEITESVMMIDTTNPSNNNKIENNTLKCQIPSETSFCTMDLIFPVEGNCFAKFIRRDIVPWGLSTECNISKVYSSLGRYKCEFYSVLSNKETSIFTQNSPVLTSAGGKYKSLSCAFTGNMPTDEGLYIYKAIITPGRKIITATSIDSLEILRPTKSAVRCSPSPDVPENTNVTCTCSTTNIGKPSGHLKWYRGNNQIGTGEYGDSTLVMSQTLYRSDSGVTQFRCDVDWTSVTSGDTFTISVGYVGQSMIKINNMLNLSVAENQIVMFNCSSDGRPTPSMSLINKGNETLIRKATSPLIHTLIAAQCEDTSMYVCIASNGMGKDTASAANMYVNCKPRLHSDTVVPDTLRPMKYNGQAVTQTFTIIAYPTPSNFSFLFWGSGTSTCACKSAVINIVLKMTCTNLPTLFMSTCTLSVDNMTNSDSAGVYSVTLTNAHGSVDLKFQVDVDGTSESETTSAGFVQGVGVGVGVIVAAIAILALFTVFYLWRKKQKLTCIDKTVESHESPLTPLTSLNKDVSEIPMDTTFAKPPGLYDPLRQSEIGLVSQYSELSQYESISESRKESEGKSKGTPVAHVYQNTTVI